MNQKTEIKTKEIVQLVVFRLREEEFAVPIEQVTKIVRIPEITKVPEAPNFIEGVINLRGDVLAVIDLAKEFDLPPIAKKPKSARIIVAEINEKNIGLLVDEVPELVKISRENIEPAPEIIQTKVKQEFISGVGKVGERLLILLNLNKILQPEKVSQLDQLTKNN